MRPTLIAAAALALVAPAAHAQRTAAQLSNGVRQYVTVAEPVVVVANATVIDGTGAAPRTGQTIVIRDGRIAEVGPSSSVRAPEGARVIDASGHTVIPGLVGMHNHLFYTAAGGHANQMSYTGPRLYLGSGVTTIRTTGGRTPYAEINLREAIDSGRTPGPRIHITAPYITGGVNGSAGSMATVNSPEQARRFVAYWAQEGATWVKAYTDITRRDLGAAIDEAHRRGMKVTGHLCSVSFQEAVDLGIDNLEHGLLTATDFDGTKKADACPPNGMAVSGAATKASAAWDATIRKMIDRKVGMTSTLAVFEPFFPGRAALDERTAAAMAPEVATAYRAMRAQIDTAKGYPLTVEMLRNAMAFEKAFVEAGGLLAAGVDPTGSGGALAGFGDHRNYELLVEGGFSAPRAVQVMSLNGAKILGIDKDLGSVEKGKVADLVLLRGDLMRDAAVIRNVTTVFKDGVGYDSAKLFAAVKGRVGID